MYDLLNGFIIDPRIPTRDPIGEMSLESVGAYIVVVVMCDWIVKVFRVCVYEMATMDDAQVTVNDAKTADGACYLEIKVSSRSKRDGCWDFLDRYGYRYGDAIAHPLLPSKDISMMTLKKVSTHVDIIKSSRYGNPKFESLEVEVHDLQVAVAHYHQSNGVSRGMFGLIISHGAIIEILGAEVEEFIGHTENGSDTDNWL
ncbi:hypothetical protein Tco_0550393 [Tanacetum coccineum]